jgi:hypothetical protein
MDEVRRLHREVEALHEERDILRDAAAWFARETSSLPPREGVRVPQETHRMHRVSGARRHRQPASAWQARPPSVRAQADRALRERIRIHERS